MRALDSLIVAVLARVEVPAALWRKHRAGALDREEAEALVSEFTLDFRGTESEPPRFHAVRLTSSVLDAAAGHVAVHGLRAYEAVQLACAVAAHAADPQCAGFACFDADLRAAAAASGLDLVPSPS